MKSTVAKTPQRLPSRTRDWEKVVVLSLPILFLVGFMVAPLFSIFVYSFYRLDPITGMMVQDFTLSNYIRFFQQPVFLGSLGAYRRNHLDGYLDLSRFVLSCCLFHSDQGVASLAAGASFSSCAAVVDQLSDSQFLLDGGAQDQRGSRYDTYGYGSNSGARFVIVYAASGNHWASPLIHADYDFGHLCRPQDPRHVALGSGARSRRNPSEGFLEGNATALFSRHCHWNPFGGRAGFGVFLDAADTRWAGGFADR